MPVNGAYNFKRAVKAAQHGLVRWKREELDADRNLLAVWIKP